MWCTRCWGKVSLTLQNSLGTFSSRGPCSWLCPRPSVNFLNPPRLSWTLQLGGWLDKLPPPIFSHTSIHTKGPKCAVQEKFKIKFFWHCYEANLTKLRLELELVCYLEKQIINVIKNVSLLKNINRFDWKVLWKWV